MLCRTFVSDFFIVGRDGYEHARRNAIDVFNNAVPADNIENKTCCVGHCRHLNHSFCAVFEYAKHTRAHLAAGCLLKDSVGVAGVVVKLLINIPIADAVYCSRYRHGTYVEFFGQCSYTEC